MNSQSWGDIVARHARVRGCLLGGAIGDALGYPIEFQPLASIRNGYGPSGVTGFLPVGGVVLGQVSDDTQMTLFTAEGLIRAYARYGPATDNGISSAGPVLVRNAYLRWLDTQNHPAPPPPAELAHDRTGWLRQQTWLYARRAPGNACVSGLRYEHIPDKLGELGAPGPVNPDSKGCGTVMRSAPFGLTGMPVRRAFEFAARCAQITHGHPTGYYAAGAFAAMIGHLLDGDSLEGAVLRSMELLARYPGHEETTAALRKAVDLAADGTATPRRSKPSAEAGSPRRPWPSPSTVPSPAPPTRHPGARALSQPSCSPSTTPVTATPRDPSAATSSAPTTATSPSPVLAHRRRGPWHDHRAGRRLLGGVPPPHPPAVQRVVLRPRALPEELTPLGHGRPPGTVRQCPGMMEGCGWKRSPGSG